MRFTLRLRRPGRTLGPPSLDGERQRARPARRFVVPVPEVLEGRTLLGTFSVLNEHGGGPGSLRQAVLDANAAPGADTITFAPTVHRIILTDGELAIADDLDILGPGAHRLSIGGSDASRVLDFLAGATARVSGVTVTRGRADGNSPAYPSTGGGILNQGSLTLDGVVVAHNRAIGDPAALVHVNEVFNIAGGAVGGGLANFGTLTVTGCSFVDNEARGADDTDASSLPFFAFPGNALGGGLANFGAANLDSSEFVGNLALAGSGGLGAFAAIGGGGAVLNDAAMTIAGSSFRMNRAVGGDGSLSPSHNGHALGGGIMSGSLTALHGAPGADLTVLRSEFFHNQALGGNDNRVTDLVVPPSDAPDNAYGGGILIYQGRAAVATTRLRLNQAIGGAGLGVNGKGSLGVGGGIFFYNFVGGVTATVESSVITDNDAIGGSGRDGIVGGDGLGGGIAIGGLGSPFTGPGSITIRDTILTRNLAQGGDGGRGGDGGDGLGGGLFNDGNSTLSLTAVTIVRNRARGGHGRAGGRAGQGLGDNIYNIF